jgi:phasin family protein
MITKPEQFVAVGKAQLDASVRFAAIAAEGAEKILDLQFKNAKASFDEVVKNAKAFTELKDVSQIASWAGTRFQPGLDKTTAYGKSVYDVATGTQQEIGASILGPKYLEYTVNKREPQPEGNRSLIAAPYGPYQCKGNDRWCVIAVYNQDEWERFVALLAKQGLNSDPKFATHLQRVRHKKELDAWVTSWTKQNDPYQVMEMVQGVDVCAAVVQDVEDQFKNDKQYAATGFLVHMVEPEAGDMVTENVPVRLSETPGKVRGLAPLMGEHTHEIARNLLGLSDEEIEKLDEEKVLY